MANIHVTAKDAEGNDFTAKMTPKKGAKIDLNQIKRSLEAMGMADVVVKYKGEVAK